MICFSSFLYPVIKFLSTNNAFCLDSIPQYCSVLFQPVLHFQLQLPQVPTLPYALYQFGIFTVPFPPDIFSYRQKTTVSLVYPLYP